MYLLYLFPALITVALVMVQTKAQAHKNVALELHMLRHIVLVSSGVAVLGHWLLFSSWYLALADTAFVYGAFLAILILLPLCLNYCVIKLFY
ncbi:hypothetical protein E5K00_08925 [Hymenobacter aquaticus]|uniref:Uncharacterized protein n=1 Tax=Hymenobacter aquaticus TaxID=1867101 RepID=A0A4Z0Q6H9_9BACT|nr:hypothetical protein [Hymenobacter aquaticus]TGE25295.1 hypothetical protein E5K00_08925 [Hymenobacter aquaticus]